jgi:salicylate 5-hydroxylase large subunit
MRTQKFYQEELSRFFYKNHWCYVGLEAEIPLPGDFKRTVIGERSSNYGTWQKNGDIRN